jgi:hypothetical protein
MTELKRPSSSTHAGILRPLCLPEPISVGEDKCGNPSIITLKGRHQVAEILDSWRIDDEWWRQEPISRMYYKVLLESGRQIVIYKDLIDLKWYRQDY